MRGRWRFAVSSEAAAGESSPSVLCPPVTKRGRPGLAPDRCAHRPVRDIQLHYRENFAGNSRPTQWLDS